MENEKKNRYIFFSNFPIAGNEKKIMLEQKLEWATAQVYYKRKGFCIAIQSMYCKLERLE